MHSKKIARLASLAATNAPDSLSVIRRKYDTKQKSSALRTGHVTRRAKWPESSKKLSAMFSTAERVQKQANPTVFREAVKTQPPHVAERYGLRVNPNPGAGNCGMHVVHEHVIKLDKYKGLSLQDVRNRVADELLRDPEYYSGFIVGAQYEEKGRGVLDSVAFNAYVVKTRRPGTYTDHPEWAATRRAFPELPPFVFVSPSTTSYGTKLVQSYFGDQSTCAASKHLGENGVTAESLQALNPDYRNLFYQVRRRTF